MIVLRAGSKHLIREINQAIVLDTVRAHGALSRTDIAARTELALPTVSAIAAELIETGLLVERSTRVSTGGRPAVLLELNAQAGYVVGVKITERLATLVVTDLEAAVVARTEVELPAADPDAIAAVLAAAVRGLNVPGRTMLGVGVGMAGVIDRTLGLVRHATYFGWRDLPFGAMLERALELPVVVDNDVNALTAAEQWFGAGRGVAHFLVISLGRGVGMGMVLDGRLYRGAGGGAGEFGHMVVKADGPLCACGKQGCLEALVSDPALVERASLALGQPVGMEEAVAAAQAGDPALRRIFAEAGQTLGTAAANVVNLLNPALIVVGGEGTRAGTLLMNPFEDALRAHAFDGLCSDLRIVTEPWGDDAWARGAASLLLGELFEPALRPGQEVRPSLTARPL